MSCAPAAYVLFALLPASVAYLRPPWQKHSPQLHDLQELTFIHIPKNAGTSIESTAKAKGINWGKYDQFGRCPWFPCNKHHVPPSWMRGTCGRSYRETDTFCVTRHPFERAVSQYKYEVKRAEVKGNSASCSASVMNKKLQWLVMLVKAKQPVKDCHMLPQSEYVWDYVTAGGRQQLCKHVLRIEDMPQAFNGLMAAKNLSARLGVKARNPGSCENLSVDDLAPQVRRLIHEVYHDDFERLNYTFEESKSRPSWKLKGQDLEFFLTEGSSEVETEAPF